MMAQFRKKPVVIEAIQLSKTNWREVLALNPDKIHWLGNRLRPGGDDAALDCIGVVIDTLEGAMTAQIGDWIIRGINGEFYPCKPDIFVGTYEPVDCDDTPSTPYASNLSDSLPHLSQSSPKNFTPSQGRKRGTP